MGGRTLQVHEVRTMRRNEHGQVEVFDPHRNGGKGEWRWVPYVDAVEMLKVGSANLDGPPEAPRSPAGHSTPAPDADGDKDGADDKDDGEGDDYDFNQHNMEELRAFATEAKLTLPHNVSKAKLIEMLDRSGFKPGKE